MMLGKKDSSAADYGKSDAISKDLKYSIDYSE
jgi:hypothetical protein